MMKRLYLDTKYGMRDARDLWKSRMDGYISGMLNDIENGGGLTFDKISKIYNHFNAIAEVDEPFELTWFSGDEVCVYWPNDRWRVTFKLK